MAVCLFNEASVWLVMFMPDRRPWVVSDPTILMVGFGFILWGNLIILKF